MAVYINDANIANSTIGSTAVSTTTKIIPVDVKVGDIDSGNTVTPAYLDAIVAAIYQLDSRIGGMLSYTNQTLSLSKTTSGYSVVLTTNSSSSGMYVIQNSTSGAGIYISCTASVIKPGMGITRNTTGVSYDSDNACIYNTVNGNYASGIHITAVDGATGIYINKSNTSSADYTVLIGANYGISGAADAAAMEIRFSNDDEVNNYGLHIIHVHDGMLNKDLIKVTAYDGWFDTGVYVFNYHNTFDSLAHLDSTGTWTAVGYNAGANLGRTATVTVKDSTGANKTMIFTGGILTGGTLLP